MSRTASLKTEPRLTPEEYLAIERAAPTKSEFVDGRMFAMAGAAFPSPDRERPNGPGEQEMIP